MATHTLTGSKPDQIDALRATWRKSAEHKAAQVKRFFSALAGVIIVQLIGDVASGKDPLTHFTDLRTAWYYLLPFALVAWRQLHPAMTASQVDSAPGATIVPDQVGADPDVPDQPEQPPAPDPEPEPEPEPPVDPAPDTPVDPAPDTPEPLLGVVRPPAKKAAAKKAPAKKAVAKKAAPAKKAPAKKA